MAEVGLHVDVHEGNGPPVLLVHGIMAGRALWDANLEELRAVATPVVVELFGHGRSPTPVEEVFYQPAAYVTEFERIRNQLGAERWLVIGQSLGAALTLRYVLDRPERVIGHVITNSVSALARSVGGGAQEMESAARRIEEGGHGVLSEHSLNPARSRRIVGPVREALAADQHLLDPAGIAAAVRHTAQGASSRTRAGENRVPTLIVAGTREKAFEEPCRFAEATMPFVEVTRVDAGHSPNAEVPDVFNEAVRRFVTRLLV